MSIELAPTISGAPVSRWERYPAYRDSGVEWLGEVPEGWITWKITHGFQQVGSGTTPKSDDMQYYNGEIPWVTTSELRETVITDTKSKLTEKALNDYSSLHIYPPETLLFAMYGATIGRMGLLKTHATVNQACCAFTDSKFLYPKFTFYWLWMRRPILITLSVGGGQPNLSQDDLRTIRIPAPSLPEQRAIAAFLDRETGRIDALIAKKERQVELLQEKRAALISHAVTKGLDPDVKMRDSGVEWLGGVPEEWEVKRVKSFTAMHKQGYYTEQAYIGEGIKLARITDIDDFGNVFFKNMPFVAISPNDERSFELKNGDFLFARSGTIGRFGLVRNPERSVFASYLILFRFKGVEKEFLRYAFGSNIFKEGLISTLHGGANQNVHAENIKEQFLAEPPHPDQRAIVAFLDRETGRIDTLTAKIRESISKLREYRTALISAAVTGKIDLRQEVA